MKFDELFEQRSLVASKLKDCIRDLGYTKVSFASKADISRPTLNKLLNGGIDNKSSFDRHLQKILKLLNMTVEELIECLMDIPVEQWDMNVVFGSAYTGMDVVIVEEVSGQIELSF